jgi:5'-methylthioinosine phosphorylase
VGRLAVILGSSAAGTGGEAIAAAESAGAIVLQRHGGGADEYRLPHEIDHAANLRSLLEAGCERALAVCSVGSLRAEIGIGEIVCPDDFIALQVTETVLSGPRGHAVAGFDRDWRPELLAAWARAAPGPLRDGGVYWQTNGPRFETPAEIRLIAGHAHVVGMTLASECIVAGELGLPYAAICMVDNLANGIAARPLAPAQLERDREANASRLGESLAALGAELTG